MFPEDLIPVADVIRSHERFVVIAHFRPDGDAIGSTIALGKALQGMGKQVRMLNEDPVPERYAFLEGSAEIGITPEEPIGAEVVISVDNGAWKRLGDRSIVALAHAPLVVNIDHHASNERFGAVNCVLPDEAATGCILYKLIRFLDVPITPDIANALYAAISTDTGSFQYEKTTPEVMAIAGDLLSKGVNVMEINRLLYQEVTWKSLMVTREVLNGMVLEEEGRLSWFVLDLETKLRLGASPDDVSDLVDTIRVIRGVKVAVIFEEMEPEVIRVSMRSKDPRVNVAKIAEQFRGGGHALAAGIRIRRPLLEARDCVLQAIRIACREALG